MRAFAWRNTKEILRDPLNMFFGLGFPLVILLLMTAIQSNIPVEVYAIGRLTPGIAVFGLSFIALFSATLISKDRSTSLLMRLCASPLPASGFILGYALPLLPMAIAQSLICFLAAWPMGLPFDARAVLAVLALIPAALFNIGLGLAAGSLLNDKQVGGVCGALLTNLSAWFSGAWFDLSLVGGWFKGIAYALPFAHATDAAKAAVAGNFGAMPMHIAWVLVYAALALAGAALAFRRSMRLGGA